MDVIVYLTLLPAVVSAMGYDCPYKKCFCVENTIDCDGIELKALPDVLPMNNSYLMFLSLSNNQLTTIPAGHLPLGIFGIDFEVNPITTIDENAFTGIPLTQLEFSQALFTELPRALLHVDTLQYLTIGNMNITKYDDDVVKHIGQSLITLIMSNAGLTEWPAWIANVPHLNTLSLTNMAFQIPDNAFDNLVSTLSSVNFENCSLTDIPPAFSKLYELTSLVMDSNNIVNISPLPYWTKITTLSLDYNQISDARNLGKALSPVRESLQTLQIRNNKLTSVPDFSAMTALTSLYLTQNVIASVGVGKMPSSLTSLNMEYNHLPSLYSFMQTGVNLTLLRFHSNLITDIRGVDIPTRVSDMDVSLNLIQRLTETSFPANSALESLTLDNNPLTDISPAGFNNLQKLSFLSMVATRIARLPLALGGVTSLRTLALDRNPVLVCTCGEKGLRDVFTRQQVEVMGDCGLTSIVYFLTVLSQGCPT